MADSMLQMQGAFRRFLINRTPGWVGAVPLGSASLSASGKATLTITLPAGGHAITAAYPGSEVFASSRGTLRQNVGPVRTRAARP